MLILRDMVVEDGQVDIMDDGTTVQAFTIKMAAIIFTTLPILVVYPFLQKYFMKGILVGSIKE